MVDTARRKVIERYGQGSVPVFSVDLVDESGVEYRMELSVNLGDLHRFAIRLLRAQGNTSTTGDGAVTGSIRSTGKVYPVDGNLAVVRRRYRTADEAEDGDDGDDAARIQSQDREA
jgi:hypothetical protein